MVPVYPAESSDLGDLSSDNWLSKEGLVAVEEDEEEVILLVPPVTVESVESVEVGGIQL